MEDNIYKKGSITVTKTLLKIGGTSYPINGIGSMFIAAPSRGFSIFMGSVVLLVGIFVISANKGGVGIAIGFIAVGAFVLIRGVLKPYVLVLRTASGDQPACRARQFETLAEIKGAVETAVSLRQ